MARNNPFKSISVRPRPRASRHKKHKLPLEMAEKMVPKFPQPFIYIYIYKVCLKQEKFHITEKSCAVFLIQYCGIPKPFLESA